MAGDDLPRVHVKVDDKTEAVSLNGINISHLLHGLTISAQARCLPKITLDISGYLEALIDGSVELDSDSEQLLRSLGWQHGSDSESI